MNKNDATFHKDDSTSLFDDELHFVYFVRIRFHAFVRIVFSLNRGSQLHRYTEATGMLV